MKRRPANTRNQQRRVRVRVTDRLVYDLRLYSELLAHTTPTAAPATAPFATTAPTPATWAGRAS